MCGLRGWYAYGPTGRVGPYAVKRACSRWHLAGFDLAPWTTADARNPGKQPVTSERAATDLPLYLLESDGERRESAGLRLDAEQFIL